MYLADTLSRAYPKDTVPHATPQSKFCHAIEELDLTEHLAIMKERWQQMHEDPNLRVLMLVVQQGWPHKSLASMKAKPYYKKCHDELSV